MTPLPILQILGRGGRDVLLVPGPSRGASCNSCGECNFAVSVMIDGGCTTCPFCNRDLWNEDSDELDTSETCIYSDMVFFCDDCGIRFDFCCSHNEDVTDHAKIITAVVDREIGERFEGMPVFRSEVDCYHFLKDACKPLWRCRCRGACSQLSHAHSGGKRRCCKSRDKAAVIAYSGPTMSGYDAVGRRWVYATSH
jgi:hypothetical protein